MKLRRPVLTFVLTGAILLAGLTSAFLFLGAQSARESRVPPEKLTIAISTSLNPALVKIAEARSFLRDEGLDTTLLIHTSGKAALQSLLEGKADLATVAETPLMFAIMKGAKLSIIATIQTATRNQAIVARKDKGITSAADLKGRRIGVTLGTTADYFLDTYLVVQGMARSEVEFVNLKPEEMNDALMQGRVDAVSVWNPWVANLAKALGESGITFHNEKNYTEAFNAVSTAAFTERSPETVLRFLRALVRAEAFVAANPAESQEIMSQFSHIDRDLLSGIWNDFQFNLSLTQSLLFTLEDEARWAMRSRLVAEREMADFFDSFYTGGLQTVKPASIRIIR